MKTWKKVVLIVVVAPIVLIVGSYFLFTTPEERAALDAKHKADVQKQEQAEAQAKEEERQNALDNGRKATDAFVQKLTALRRNLPRPEALKEQRCPESLSDPQVKFLPADYAYFTQFTETGFKAQPEDTAFWYRGLILDNAQKAMAGKPPAEWDTAAIANSAKEFDAKAYLAVIAPLNQRSPQVSADGKSFSGGHFEGWAIVVDTKSLQPVCQVRLTAHSSAKVTDRYLAVGPKDPEHSLKIGANMKKAVDEDFTANFWEAFNQAIGTVAKKADGAASAP